jgi:hypothetical protein
MELRGSSTVVAMLVVACASLLSAQKTTQIHPGRGGSPHVRTEWTVDGASIAIEYGRPFLKGRPESQMMPPGSPWRTGADEGTILRTDKPIKFGQLAIPAGSYSLYTVPGQSEWQLVINRQTEQDGLPSESNDLGRLPMTVTKTAAPVEQLTISIDDTPTGATLRIEWGTTRASIGFTVG